MKRSLLLILGLLMFGALSIQAQNDCANALNLSINQLSCSGSNFITGNTVGQPANGVDASAAPGCYDATASNGFWYEFTAIGTDISVTSSGANDPYFMLFSGACGSLTIVACHDLSTDFTDIPTEGDDLLVVGDTYYLWIGFDGTTNPFSVCVFNEESPDNDECDAATILSATEILCGTNGNMTVEGTTIGSSTDAWNFAGCYNPFVNGWDGVWYRFTASGWDITIEDMEDNNPYVVILNGCDPADPTYYLCQELPISTVEGDNALMPGEEYLMYVGFDNDVEDDFELCINNAPPPANDICTEAIDINNSLACLSSPSGIPILDSTNWATDDFSGVAGCLINDGTERDGVWFTFEPNGVDLVIESLITGNNPYVVLFDDCDLNAANVIYCGQTPIDLGTANNLNTDFNWHPLDEFPSTLYMWVGYEDGAESTFELCIENPEQPENDLCENATQIVNLSDSLCTMDLIPGTTDWSTTWGNALMPNDSVPPCLDGMVDEQVWYTFTATGVDLYITDEEGNNPSFAILSNLECYNTFDFITCGELPFEGDNLLQVGQEYTLIVGFNGGHLFTDTFNLCFFNPPPPSNDMCERAEQIPDENLMCPDIGGTLNGTTIHASNYEYPNNVANDLITCIDTAIESAVWYRFTATGVDLAIEDEMIGNEEPYVVIMEYNDCLDTAVVVVCEQVPFFLENALSFDQDYLMMVAYEGGLDAQDDFELCITNDGVCNGTPPPASYCQTTPICGLAQLNAFCMEMQPQGIGTAPWPGCSVTLHDPNWFTFVAGADQLEIEVTVSNCMNTGTNAGVQIEMYEIPCDQELGPDQPFCDPAELGSPLGGCGWAETQVPPGTTVTFSGATEFGHVYGIVIDGWIGDLCTIEIDVLVGGNPPNLDTIVLEQPEWDDSGFPFSGDTICAGAVDVQFALEDEVPGACRYDWTVNGVLYEEGTNEIVEYLDFPDPGVFQICVRGSNTCTATMPICDTVVVAALDPTYQIDTVCEGDVYEWISIFGDPINAGIDTEEGGLYTYEEEVFNQAGCRIDATLDLFVLDENDDNPTVVDSVVCSPTNFTFYSNEIIPIPANGVLENFELDRPIAHGDRACDSFFILNVYELWANLEYDEVICNGEFVEVIPNGNENDWIVPDRFIYTEMEVDFEWRRAGESHVIGLNDPTLFLDLDSFLSRITDFELTVTLRWDGKPATGCVFTFDATVDLNDILVDSAYVNGPDTVCPGFQAMYVAEQYSILRPFPEDPGYIWDVSNMPGAVLDDGNSDRFKDTMLITFNQVGMGYICATPVNNCAEGEPACKLIVVEEPPSFSAGPDDEECTNTYALQAEGTVGTWITIATPVDAPDPSFAPATSPNAEVTISQKGVYTFGWIVETNGCLDTTEVIIDFIEAIQLTSIEYTCDDVAENYTVVIDFIGGTPPYTVTSGNATLNGMTLTSDPLTNGVPDVIIIEDAIGCTGSFPVDYNCPCLTGGATMQGATIELCALDCATITPFSPSMPDPNDVEYFVLHTSATDMLGTVIDFNQTGEFCFDATSMAFGTTYYASIYVGNSDGAGFIDPQDSCRKLAIGQPMVWNENPDPNITADDGTCSDMYQLMVQNSNYPGQWTIKSGINVTFSDRTDPNATVTALSCGLTVLQWVESNGTCIDSTEIEIDFYCNPTVADMNIDCNADQTFLVVTIEIAGNGPFVEQSGRGNFTGNIFTIDNLALNTADQLIFVDANGCELIVDIPVRDCSCLPNLPPDTVVCGLTITLNATGGTGISGLWTALDPSTATFLGDPSNRIVDVQVDDYGMHCFNWLEIGEFCQGDDEFCATFVQNPTVDPATIVYTCDAESENYTISFTINDGDPGSYVVTGVNGNITGNEFTSVAIPSDQAVSLTVTDQYMCDPLVLDLTHSCGCLTQVGSLDPNMLNLCLDEDAVAIYDATNEVLDGNDVLLYILSTDPVDPLNTILVSKPNNTFSFTDAALVAGTVYYITVVIGDESSGGNIDLLDDCTVFSNSVPVVWFEDPEFELMADNSMITCAITEINLSIITSEDLSLYDIQWTATGGGTIVSGDEKSETPTVTSAGTYTLTLTNNAAGCSSERSIQIVPSTDLPEIVFGNPQLLTCDRSEVVVSAEGSTSGADITYQWSGPNIIGDATGITITVGTAGQYTLVLTDNANNCSVNASINVMEDMEAPSISLQAPDKIDCSTVQVGVLSAGSSSGPNFSYSWTVLNGVGTILGGNTGNSIQVDGEGVYELTITNTNNGCSSSDQIEVEQDPTVISGIDATIGQLDCDGSSPGSITLNAIGGTAPYQYSIDGGQTLSPSSAFSELGAGVYPLFIQDALGCTDRDTVEIIEPSDFYVELGPTYVIELGDTAFIEIESNLPFDQFEEIVWTPLFDSLNSGAPYQIFVPDLGEYSIRVQVTNANGCIREDFLNLRVRFNERIYVPNAFSPSSDNPSNQRLYVFADPESVRSIENFAIFNRWGERVFQRPELIPTQNPSSTDAWDGMWQGDEAPSAVYVYYMEVEFVTGVRKVIKGEVNLIR